MDKWVVLHTNNKFLPASSLICTIDRLLQLLTVLVLRVSAGLSLCFLFFDYHYSVSFVILAVFFSFFSYRARVRQGNLVLPKSLTNRNVFITTFFETSHYNIHTPLFSSKSSWEEERREEERKKLFRHWGRLKLYVEQRDGGWRTTTFICYNFSFLYLFLCPRAPRFFI